MVIPTATVSNSQNYKSDIDEVDIRRLTIACGVNIQHSTFVENLASGFGGKSGRHPD